MSNNPASPKKVVPNNPRIQNTKSREQQPSKPSSASASVSVTKSASSSHSRDSTSLRSSPRPETPTSPRNSTPQRDSTPQRGSTPRKDSTPHRDDISQRSSTPTNKKPVTQVVGDRTTSGSTPVREVSKEVKKSVTPEPVRSPRPLSSGFTPINSNKPTAKPVTKLAPILVTPESGDASKSKPLPSPKRQVSVDNTEVNHKRSKSASGHPVTASSSSSTSASASASASKTRVTPTPEVRQPSIAKGATVTTTDNTPTSEQSKGSIMKEQCDRCGKTFSRISDKERHENAFMKQTPILCPVPDCPGGDYKYCNSTHLSNHSLNVHARRPKLERPYLCPFEGCEKRYAATRGLQIHEAKHKNAFKCDFCGIPQGSENRLKVHVEKRSPYICKLDHEGDDVPSEGLKFCGYYTYRDHHKECHGDAQIQPRRPKDVSED